MRTSWRRLTVVLALLSVGSVALPTLALGASQLPGALYTGSSGSCSGSIKHECVFKFRVSSNGRTLRFVKKGKAISTWQCQGGGGEAIFGSSKYADAVPPARIRTDGTFSGSEGTGASLLKIAGSFAASDQKATLRFVEPKAHCETPEISLHKR